MPQGRATDGRALPSNASQLCLQSLLPQLPADCEAAVRVYPVEFAAARPLLEADLAEDYDLAIHLGQAQNTSRLRLEAVGLNVGAVPGASESECFPLVAGGPAAYQTALPLATWAEALRTEGIPAYVSWHAGTYLCNATLYWGHHILETRGLSTALCFVHVPLDISQVASLPADYLTLPSQTAARGIARIISLWMDGR
jgi:pyroglutamyl-peptidase